MLSITFKSGRFFLSMRNFYTLQSKGIKQFIFKSMLIRIQTIWQNHQLLYRKIQH
jgi:hypothetical protein